jgi:anaerobic selenocysteine-containing dehydrogenase
MTHKFSRREFLKLTGVGATAAMVLTGCGPMARYVTRRPYTDMPEYNQTGVSTYYATTCRECPAGCGIVMRTMEGRAIKAEGNAIHPVNLGKICQRGLTSVQGLYNPDRIRGPVKHARGSATYDTLTWDNAVAFVKDTLTNTPPTGIAFLMGLAPDHLFDFVSELTGALGAPAPLRYGALGVFDGRSTLVAAAKTAFGKAVIPFFDLANSDLVFSFGANFMETWLSPVGYSLAFGKSRKGSSGKRGYMVTFEPRMSLTSGKADEWYPVVPGTEGMVAQAIGYLVAQAKGGPMPVAFTGVNLDAVAKAAGIKTSDLSHLADLFVKAGHPLALPGGGALGHANGTAAAQSILALNVLAGNLGQPGGVYLNPVEDQTNTAADIQNLIKSMNDGTVKALIIHGINPVFELPSTFGFASALAKVPLVISFSSFPDETAAQSDYVLPDHTGLESFGYQRILPGADREIYSAAQPVVAPLYNTKATVDVLLGAVHAVGGNLATRVNYTDEVDFLQKKLVPLVAHSDGSYSAPEIFTFWAKFLQYGGWWHNAPALLAPKAAGFLDQALPAVNPLPAASPGQLNLVVYPTQLGDGSGANRPWLQETPDPMTTVTWGTWVEIHPDTAKTLGITDDDVVNITSPAGTIQVSVYRYPAIRPDTVGIPFGQGHEALGMFASGRGANAAKLLQLITDESAGFAFGDTRVTITATGQQKQLARVESKEGVYGNN